MTRSPLYLLLAAQLAATQAPLSVIQATEERRTPSVETTLIAEARVPQCFSKPPTYLGVVMTYRRSATSPSYSSFDCLA